MKKILTFGFLLSILVTLLSGVHNEENADLLQKTF